MRKITQESVSAFLDGKPFKKGNMEVEISERHNIKFLMLHGHTIAIMENGKLRISNCGWKTKTTKERLNGLPDVHIQQKKGLWYLNGCYWNGNMISISILKDTNNKDMFNESDLDTIFKS